MNKGGVLVRFAGPRLAANADDLIPVPLRAGGRMLGGALSWGQPAKLAPFGETSPFHGLAIIPFLHGSVVNDFHWLDERQFLDAVAVAMITPGPVVITVGFIGYLVAGFPGACVAALATFLPCYLITIGTAPYFKKIAGNLSVKAFVDGITAAVIGALVGAVIIIGIRSIIDFPTALIGLTSVIVLIFLKKITEPYIILFAAIIGLILNTMIS